LKQKTEATKITELNDGNTQLRKL